MDHKSPPSGTMPRAHGFLPAFRSLASYRFRPKQCPSSCYDMMLPPRTTIDEQIALSFCRPDDVVFSTKKEPWRRGAQNSRTTRARRLSASERAEQTCCNTPKRKISRGTASIPSVARASCRTAPASIGSSRRRPVADQSFYGSRNPS
jgi:hypothetical protein